MFQPATICLVLAGLLHSLHAGPHLGPVADILVADGQVYSSSQAGIFVGIGDDLAKVVRPEYRVTRLALVRGRGEGENLLFFAGGKPGEKGALGSIRQKPGENESCVYWELARDLIYDLAVSPDNKSVAIAGADGLVLVSDPHRLTNGKWSVRHKHTAAARAVAFSPDGRWLASAGLDGVIMISSVDPGPDHALRQLLDHTAGIECLVFSPDSQVIATGSKDSKVRLHRVTGKLIRTYTGLGMENEPVAGRVPSRVLSLAWNDSTLIAGTSKGALYHLSQTDDTTEKIVRPGTDPIYALAFGPKDVILLGGQSQLYPVTHRPDVEEQP